MNHEEQGQTTTSTADEAVSGETEFAATATDEATDVNSELTDLRQQLADMTAKADDNWQKALRAVSDLDNTRKRAERDVAAAHKFGVEKLVLELLPIIDSLEQAVTSAAQMQVETSQDLLQGVELTLKMFTDALAKFGVVVINPIDEKFDPSRHEAMTMQPHDNKPQGMVLDVLQKGYCLNERVIRPARVIVVK